MCTHFLEMELDNFLRMPDKKFFDPTPESALFGKSEKNHKSQGILALPQHVYPASPDISLFYCP